MIARRPRPRVNVLGPALLIGLGAIALLFTSGHLGPDAGGRLFELWPLVLVLVGVQIVVAHLLPGRAGALVALVAMLAVITLGVGLALRVPVAPPTYRASGPVAGVPAGTLRLDAGPGTVRLTGRDLGGELYRAEVAQGAYAEASSGLPRGTLHLSTVGPGVVDLALSDRVPWGVTINGAGLGGQVDLSGLDLSGFTLSGAGAKLDLRLPAEPRGTMTVAVSGVAMDLTVRVPGQTAAHAVAQGLATSLDVNGTTPSGQVWISPPGTDTAAGRYEVRVTGVASHVRLETMP